MEVKTGVDDAPVHAVVMPCDELCPKCGSGDVFRKWFDAGDKIEPWHYGDPQPPAARGRSRSWKADREHISHRCRCCGHWWASDILEA